MTAEVICALIGPTPHTIFHEILMTYLKGGPIGHRFDHRWIQQTKPVSAAGNFIAHF